MPRPLTTGRYESRERLEEQVWFLWKETAANQGDIARITQVSYGTVASILNRASKKLWRKT